MFCKLHTYCMCFLLLQSSLVAIKAELDDVIVGLADAGVLNAIRNYPQLFECLFVYQYDPLTAGKDMNTAKE